MFARANEREPFQNYNLLSGFNSEELNYSKGIYSEEDDTLTLESDYLGIRPIFYINHLGVFAFCSEIEPLLSLFPNSLSLDYHSISFYLKHGLSPENKTFFKEVSLLPANSKLTFKEGVVSLKEKENPFQYLQKPTLDEVKETLEFSLQSWIEHYQIKSANLSGGADTRLLLALLKDKQRKGFKFFVDSSPFLEEENDKDVIVAKLLAEKFNLNLTVQRHVAVSLEKNNLYTRNPPANIPKISGNHGGEILGADVFSTLHFLYQGQPQDIPENLFNSIDNCSNEMALKVPIEHKEKYLWGIKNLFHPFFTDIYGGGSLNHWTMPHRFSLKKYAPFWSNKLVYQLSLLGAEDLNGYNFYKEIYETFFAEFSKVPFFSPLASHHKNFKLISVGENQKDSLRRDTLENNFEMIREELSHSRLFNYESIAALVENNQELAKRVIKLFLWFKSFYPLAL